MNVKFRWNTTRNYRLILWAWMMGDVTVVFLPVEISHSGFYLYGVIYILTAIFIGIPLVYSEICIAQYTNCGLISMWNYFPLFRSVGYGTVFLVLIKITYIIVLCSWYLNYTFHAAIDPPPWFSCDEFNDSKCMIKRLNTSIFQHCIETQLLFKDDCEIKTASSCFFEREIGKNNTMQFNCVFQWKLIINNCLISFVMFILFIRKEKNIRIAIKILVAYVCFVSFILFCMSLSASGAWYATKIYIRWDDYDFDSCYLPLTRGVLSLGTGYGIISFLSNDVPFRSPATMTSRAVALFAVFFSLTFSLILYSGIKTMSYYHGEDEILELGNNSFFSIFASVSEIMSYFGRPFWSFLWFSCIFLCLFINLLILLYYLNELLAKTYVFAQRFQKLSCALLIVFICLMSSPIFCSDLTVAFRDFIEIVQLTNSFLFSISLYWIYGYNTHNVDIIFMIGVKASYFWKTIWCINPIFLMILLYMRCTKLYVNEYSNSYKIESLGLPCNILLLYVLFSIYGLTLVVGTLYELRNFHNSSTKLCNIFHTIKNWGPNDRLLFRSRKMFVAEIMTREFLYRQVRIHGYLKNKRQNDMKELDDKSRSISTEKMEWSALTSN